MRSRPTLVGAMMVQRGDADAMLCGTRGNYADHLKHVRDVIGLRGGVQTLAAMQMLILPGRQLFICDTHVNPDPDAFANWTTANTPPATSVAGHTSNASRHDPPSILTNTPTSQNGTRIDAHGS